MTQQLDNSDQDPILAEVAELGYEVQKRSIDGIEVQYIQVDNHTLDLELQTTLNNQGYIYSLTYSHPGPLPIEKAPLSQCRLPRNHSCICVFRRCSVDIYTKPISASEP
jgi:hypothetical protein